ncbi:SDR family oxidoreductase [Oligoflexus tunisiensis]|uniref:SDR family oxidoreductase n=1 Tax=Oligoflexus tunisiensis TaxID=708132 RepID=UPI000B1416BE|nr:SDR family oxidoreductase [Oligoflexus tunisiensis]
MKRVFITGGNRGIGAALVRHFAALPDHCVAFTYHQGAEASLRLMGDLQRRDQVKAFALNLNDPASIEVCLKHALDWQPGYDIVIHNAATKADGLFYFLEEKAFFEPIQLALNSFYHLNKAFLPHMIQQRWGRIILLASLAGETGQAGQTNYAAAKGALIAASKSLAREVARKGVLVNTVSPGWIATDMTEDLVGPEQLKTIPIGRIGEPEEVAQVVGFLASDASSYINGTTIQVNGGLYC